MNTKLLSIVSAVVLTLSASIVNAEPVQLTASQMDKVAAGSYYHPHYVRTSAAAYANSDAIAFGNNTYTNTYTSAFAVAGFGAQSSSSATAKSW